MHTCINKLLKDRTWTSVICLYELLIVIGKVIDHEKAKVLSIN